MMEYSRNSCQDCSRNIFKDLLLRFLQQVLFRFLMNSSWDGWLDLSRNNCCSPQGITPGILPAISPGVLPEFFFQGLFQEFFLVFLQKCLLRLHNFSGITNRNYCWDSSGYSWWDSSSNFCYNLSMDLSKQSSIFFLVGIIKGSQEHSQEQWLDIFQLKMPKKSQK